MKQIAQDLINNGVTQFVFLDLGTTSGIVIVYLVNHPDYASKPEFEVRYIDEFCVFNNLSEAWKRNAKIFDSFNNKLREFISNDYATAVFYEDVKRWSSSAAAKRYCGLLSVLERYMYYYFPIGKNIMNGVSATSVKKSLADTGKATKQDMVAAARRKYQHIYNDIYNEKNYFTDNMADALGIMHFVLSEDSTIRWSPRSIEYFNS